jgi:hypothetical protein
MDMKRTGKRQPAATPALLKLELETSSQATSSLSQEVYIHTHSTALSHLKWPQHSLNGASQACAIPIYSSPLRPSANQKAHSLDKLRTWLLSQEREKERCDAINEIIIHCRRQIVKIDQLKNTKTCTMLTGLGCKYGVIKTVQGKIHDFKV